MLSIENVTSAYGRIEVLHGVTLHVDPGEIVTLIGANGAGKTTLMHAISGVQPIIGGAIKFDGQPIEHRPAHERVAIGISQVPEGRQVFAPLSVLDNLRLGAWTCRDADQESTLARVCALFPMLAAILDVPAGALSGGQQQMLAISRALMLRPRLLLLDEPSFGLAPLLVKDIFRILAAINREERVAMLIVEQNANLALDLADRAYLLETGRVAIQGPSSVVRADEAVRRVYLGY
jgi:branched-chain amino acid transport system ATP-binding protein